MVYLNNLNQSKVQGGGGAINSAFELDRLS